MRRILSTSMNQEELHGVFSFLVPHLNVSHAEKNIPRKSRHNDLSRACYKGQYYGFRSEPIKFRFT